MLAKTEGVFTETAGGVTVAVLKKLAQSGRIGANETAVAFITGNGFKTLDAAAGRSSKVNLIDPKIEEFRRLYDKIGGQDAQAQAPAAQKTPAAAL
jgi:threonine synthase